MRPVAGPQGEAQLELQRGRGVYDPIVAENWVVSSSGQVLVWTEILRWEAPDAMFGVVDSFNVIASHPQAYQQCLFEIARNGTRVQNIQFTQPLLGIERQGSIGLRFGENDAIALRYTRRSDMGIGDNGMLPILLFARLTAHFTHEKVA